MELFLYIDESGSPSLSDTIDRNVNFYVGMCMMTEEVHQEFIDDAITKLRCESDNTPADIQCLNRGYFHASEDGPNAHSFLCRKISTIPNLDFSYEKVDKVFLSDIERPLAQSESRLHQFMASLATVVVSHAKVDCAHIYLAQRQGSMPINVSVSWHSQFVDRLIKGAVALPQIPFYLPKLEIMVVGANNPGVQICDFLLWAAIRKYEENIRCTWADRVGLREAASSRSKGDPFSRKMYSVNAPIDYPLANVDLDLVQNPFLPIDNDRLLELLTFAEKTVHHYARVGLPQHAAHLLDEIERVATAHRAATISPEDFRQLARIFIIMADTVPVYNMQSADEINRTIQAKYYLGVVYKGEEIRWFWITRWWLGVRQQLLARNSHCFDD